LLSSGSTVELSSDETCCQVIIASGKEKTRLNPFYVSEKYKRANGKWKIKRIAIFHVFPSMRLLSSSSDGRGRKDMIGRSFPKYGG